jgi:alcohol dehydrogenase
MRIFFYRAFQFIMRVAVAFLPWRFPKVVEGENSILRIPEILKKHQIGTVLVVTDRNISGLGLMNPLLAALDEAGISHPIYDGTVPNPTIDNIEEALTLYRSQNCQGIIAFGGGSPMDCAKGVGARVVRPRLTIPQMRGNLKVMHSIPLMIAIPTTAGTGSETTIAAVVSNPRTHEKYALNDISLLPRYAVLDPLITLNLPANITATTGVDALTHAVEAYIGQSNTTETRRCAREAVKLIFDNLPEACENGHNVTARANMLKASFLAGKAFTRAYVGYVHAIAHTLGGYYQVPHGLANAVILPYVLEYFGASAHRPLAELADVINLGQPGDSVEVKARLFMDKILELEARIGIPRKIDGIKKSDIPAMITNALREGNPLYPVPRILFRPDFEVLYNQIRAE